MKISLPCIPSFHVYLGNPDKKLKEANTGSANHAQEHNASPRKILPGIYAGGKSRAHMLREEMKKQMAAQEKREHRAAETIQTAWKDYRVRSEAATAKKQLEVRQQAVVTIQASWKGFRVRSEMAPAKKEREAPRRAAETIQAAWKGYRVRSGMAAAAQQSTPYGSSVHLQLATHGYSPANLKQSPIGSEQRAAEYAVYLNTNDIPPGKPAFLHSFQREQALNSAIVAYDAPPGWEGMGNVYTPDIGGDVGHDMKLNSIWLLGLAHHEKSAVLTTPLDDETLVRNSAKEGPPEKRNTEHNFSALGREVMGMVQKGQFVPRYEVNGLQVLHPTPKAQLATLEDFKTPKGMKKEAIREKLADHGIDVSMISTS